MGLWKKGKHRKPHPDPSTELRLQNILALVRMRDSCEQQVRLYQAAIEETHESDSNVITHGSWPANYSGHVPTKQVTAILDVNDKRRRQAEEAIRDQRALITALGQQIAEAEEGLSEYDIAYLDIASMGKK